MSNLSSDETLTKNQDCAENLNSRYNSFVNTETPLQTTLSTNDFMNMIRAQMVSRNYDMTGDTAQQIALMAFTFVVVDSADSNQTKLSAYEYNFSTINLEEVYGDKIFDYINRKYFCVTRGSNKNVPVVSFRTPIDFVKFVLDRVVGIRTFLLSDVQEFSQKYSGDGELIVAANLGKQYVLHYPVNQDSNVYAHIEKNAAGELTKLNTEFKNAKKLFDSLWIK